MKTTSREWIVKAGIPASLTPLVLACALLQSAHAAPKVQRTEGPGPEAGSQPAQWDALRGVDDRSRITPRSEDQLICFVLYTVHDGILKLSAHLYPLSPEQPHRATLSINKEGTWNEVAEARVHPVGWTATFRVEDWDSTVDWRYRVTHPLGSSLEGIVRRDPADEQVVVVAAFTGNSPGPGGGKIPKDDIVQSVLEIDPDIALFTGDQVYPHHAHTQHWLEFGELFGALTKDRPTVCLPDDHDVGQPNLWGQGGRPVARDVTGGYTRPHEYVKMVERQQTSHLPDPYDPTPIEQGIGVYYTRLVLGGVDFAIIEDRKFKSGCEDFEIQKAELGPRPDHITEAGYDPKTYDVPGKTLLGERQLRFLREWGELKDGISFKAVVSQTAFSMTSTHHGAGKDFYRADFDSNGWPQSGRNRAIDALRSAQAVHICGDQHLATLGQYGIDEFGDAGWWFCVPSIANLWPRWWEPDYEPVRKIDGPLEFLGDYLDGFGNRMTVHAHTNPRPSCREPAELHDRMPGFGVIRFDKKERKVTFECWPRSVDVTDPMQQYTGWPRTIDPFASDE